MPSVDPSIAILTDGTFVSPSDLPDPMVMLVPLVLLGVKGAEVLAVARFKSVALGMVTAALTVIGPEELLPKFSVPVDR